MIAAGMDGETMSRGKLADLYWDCKPLEDGSGCVYVVTDRIMTLIERTPIAMARRIVWEHNSRLARHDGISLARFPELRPR